MQVMRHVVTTSPSVGPRDRSNQFVAVEDPALHRVPGHSHDERGGPVVDPYDISCGAGGSDPCQANIPASTAVVERNHCLYVRNGGRIILTVHKKSSDCLLTFRRHYEDHSIVVNHTRESQRNLCGFRVVGCAEKPLHITEIFALTQAFDHRPSIHDFS